MERIKFIELVRDLFETEVLGTLETKGEDYDGDVVFSSIREFAAQLGVKSDVVIGVFLGKHLSTVYTHIKDGKLKSEPVESRIVDAINYLFLLYAYYVEEGKIKGTGGSGLSDNFIETAKTGRIQGKVPNQSAVAKVNEAEFLKP